MFRMKPMATIIAFAVLAAVAVPAFAGRAQQSQAPQAQAQPKPPELQPAIIEQPMPDFTLPAYQGGTVSLSQFKGKNVMIIFPRGYAAPNTWCTICNYRYVELAELEKAQQIQKKYNVQVLVVFPYPREIVQAWLEALPGQLDKVREGKNPADPSKLDAAGKRRMERWRQIFPNDYSLKKGEILDPFPVLVDGDHAFSKKLGLFQTEWNGGKVDQNIPSVFIVDKNGKLLFKYMGQSTVDRPSYDYLFTVLDVINGLKWGQGAARPRRRTQAVSNPSLRAASRSFESAERKWTAAAPEDRRSRAAARCSASNPRSACFSARSPADLTELSVNPRTK